MSNACDAGLLSVRAAVKLTARLRPSYLSESRVYMHDAGSWQHLRLPQRASACMVLSHMHCAPSEVVEQALERPHMAMAFVALAGACASAALIARGLTNQSIDDAPCVQLHDELSTLINAELSANWLQGK